MNCFVYVETIETTGHEFSKPWMWISDHWYVEAISAVCNPCKQRIGHGTSACRFVDLLPLPFPASPGTL